LKNTAPDAPGQLYNLASDPGETRNLYDVHADIIRELINQYGGTEENFKMPLDLDLSPM